MQSVKSPGRELAEKMWRDVTGRVPSVPKDSPSVESASSQPEPGTAPVLGSFPDLDQPAPADCGPKASSMPIPKEISPMAVATLVAGSLLCILVVWVAIFARQDTPGLSTGTTAGSTSLTTPGRQSLPTVDKPTADTLPSDKTLAENQPQPRNQPISSRGPAASVSAPGYSAEASSEGWAMEGTPPSTAPQAAGATTPPWSARDALASRTQAEAAAMLTGQEPRGEVQPPQPALSPGAPAEVSSGVAAPGVEAPSRADRPPASNSEIFARNQAPPSPGATGATALTEPAASSDLVKSREIGTESVNQSALADPSAQAQLAPGGGEIRGTAWLRGEKEFIPRLSALPASGVAENQFVAGSPQGSPPTSLTSAAPVTPQPANPTSIATNRPGEPNGGTPPSNGAPETLAHIANRPQSAATVSTPPAALVSPTASPGWGVAPNIPPVAGTSSPPGPQMIINPTVVNPSVIPATAWQAIDASSFRWAGSAQPPYAPPTTPSYPPSSGQGIGFGGGSLPTGGVGLNVGAAPGISAPAGWSTGGTPGYVGAPTTANLPPNTGTPYSPSTPGVYPAQVPATPAPAPVWGTSTGWYR